MIGLTSILLSSLFRLLSIGTSYEKRYNELVNEVEQSTLLYRNVKEQIRVLEKDRTLCWNNLNDIKSVHRKLGDYLRQFQISGKIMRHLRSQKLELTEILRRSRSLSKSRTPEKDAGYLKNRINKFKIYYDPKMYTDQLKSLRDWLNNEITNARRSADIGVNCLAKPTGNPMPIAGTRKRSPMRMKSPVRMKSTAGTRKRSPMPIAGTRTRRIDPLLNSYV